MNILMVCLGNICRSPLAEGIMQDLIVKNKLDWRVESCGTSSYHNGEQPHEGSIEIASSHGINIKNQRSALIKKSDLDYYDLILTMDASNYNNVLNICSDEKQEKKVELLLNYSFPKQNRAVPDPYYAGGFDLVFDMIYDACIKVIEKHAPAI